ncbi:hypothetical protein [Actinomadura rubrisoli]|uniref:Uncharacterized protein n=1 Tax=Actinomadura rubrisoli TaxID=2530368 RepID=A0A4R5BUJ3_9ACTN|nr:hypothetical protein [Actinomadura rubrisoli]TDD90768.1 hypothetical protein E1298_12770 [Actinomadura rubrisoli]
MAAAWRYEFADLLTDRPIATLALTGVSFDRRIIQPGAFKATIPVPNRRVAEQARRIAAPLPEEGHTGPGRTVVHVYRGARDLWGTYLLWTATPSGDERGRISVELQGASLESYLDHREIWADLTYTSVDQTTISTALVGHMQAAGGPASIGLTTASVPSGVLRNAAYKASESNTYGAKLAELANVDGGFEYMIRTYHGDAGRVREFAAAPVLGQDTTDHRFTRPGNVLSWSYPSDATTAATRWRARGDAVSDDLAADSEPLLSNIQTADPMIAAGWPYLDRTVDYQGARTVTDLDAYARWWRDTRSGVIRVPQATIRLDAKTAISPHRLGGYARLTIADDWFPLDADGRPTFSVRWRVVGLEVTPETRSAGDVARLIFAEEEETT